MEWNPDYELLGYQKEAVEWIKAKEEDKVFRGGVLGDKIGMGKTGNYLTCLVIGSLYPFFLATILAVIANCHEDRPTLVVLKAENLLNQWHAKVSGKMF